MKITVIANPFLDLPPMAIGAMEILWYDLVSEFSNFGHIVHIYGKGDPKRNNKNVTYLKGMKHSRSTIINLIKTFWFNLSILWRMKRTDVLVVNNILGPFVPRFFFWKYKKMVYNVARMPKPFYRFFRGADGLCCPSSPITTLMRSYLPKKGDRDIVTLPNPIDTTYFRPLNKSKIDDIIRIGYHGRVHPEKGIHLLAEAIKSLLPTYSKLRLCIIGACDEARGGGGESYCQRLRDILPNHIDWNPPKADRGALANSIAQIDIYCYPSLAEMGETFGVAPLEAMGLARPTIVSNLACFKDFVVHEENGLIFNHRGLSPVLALKEQLERLLSDRNLCERIAKNAAETANKYSNKHVASLYLAWFEELLQRVR